MHSLQFAIVTSAMCCSLPAAAQSYNIDFGDARSAPSATYAAAGLGGEWNAVSVPTVGVHYPLVNIQGQATGVTLNNIGGTLMLAHDDDATAGDDEALMDDMLIGFNDPVDVCIWINNVPNGEYEVLIYAWTPGDAALISRTRVDFANQGPAFIGGAWPGQQQLGATYSRHTVTVTNNRIGLHSGEFGANVQSGINGIQVRRIVQGDINGDGIVNVADLLAVITSWGPCPASPASCHADLQGDGTVDVTDLLLVITNWS